MKLEISVLPIRKQDKKRLYLHVYKQEFPSYSFKINLESVPQLRSVSVQKYPIDIPQEINLLMIYLKIKRAGNHLVKTGATEKKHIFIIS